jgi:hypothetical protein
MLITDEMMQPWRDIARQILLDMGYHVCEVA